MEIGLNDRGSEALSAPRSRLARVRAVLRNGAKFIVMRSLASPVVLHRKIRTIGRTGTITILNLHRVSKDDQSAYPPLSPELFDELLTFVGRHFNVVTFGDLKARTSDQRPKMVLSFDDGYADFLKVAMPLLRKHGLRANQNVIPECIENGLPPLNVLMQDFVGRAPMSHVRQLGIPGFPASEICGSRYEIGAKISNFLKNKPESEQRAIAEKVLPGISELKSFAPTRMLDREGVRKVAAEHEIGAHSYSHASMATESNDYLRADIDKCREYFETVLGIPLRIYALPNGSYRPEQLDVLRSEGIETILLVDEDFSSACADAHPRFTFYAGSPHEVRFRATGAFRRPRLSAGAH